MPEIQFTPEQIADGVLLWRMVTKTRPCWVTVKTPKGKKSATFPACEFWDVDGHHRFYMVGVMPRFLGRRSPFYKTHHKQTAVYPVASNAGWPISMFEGKVVSHGYPVLSEVTDHPDYAWAWPFGPCWDAFAYTPETWAQIHIEGEDPRSVVYPMEVQYVGEAITKEFAL